MIHPLFLHQNEGVNEGVNEGASEKLSDKELLVRNAMKANPSITVAKMVKELAISKASIERAIKAMKEKLLLLVKVLPKMVNGLF